MSWTDRTQPYKVAYAKQWLRSISQYKGDVPQARGHITASSRSLGVLLFAGILLIAMTYYGYCLGKNPQRDYYSLLGQAFLSGKTYFNVPPPPKQLLFPHPFDMAALNQAHALLDASVYQGRYYLYFGPVPTLIPWIPVKWLTGISLSERQLAFCFSVLGSYCLVWLVTAIALQNTSVSRWGLAFAIPSLLFGTWIPLMLQRPSVYEVAISGAYCFTATGILSLWYGTSTSSTRPICWILMGSLSFGLAAGCRLFYAWDAIILFAIWLWGIRCRGVRATIYEAFYLAAPWLCCMIALAMYNYVRFDSLLECGFRYQLNGYNRLDGYFNLWAIAYLPHNAYEYFLKPLPWSMLLPWDPDFGVVKFRQAYGLLYNSPFALWSIFAFIKLGTFQRWGGNQCGLAIGTVMYAIGITGFLLCHFCAISRYSVDFSPWIMLIAAIGYLHALQTSSGNCHKVVIWLGGFTALWSVYTGIANCFCGFGACT